MKDEDAEDTCEKNYFSFGSKHINPPYYGSAEEISTNYYNHASATIEVFKSQPSLTQTVSLPTDHSDEGKEHSNKKLRHCRQISNQSVPSNTNV